MLEHERDARSAVDRHVLRVHTALDADERARRGEQEQDVAREVREAVRLLRVLARPVDVDAAIRTDATAEERPRRTRDEFLLHQPQALSTSQLRDVAVAEIEP